MAQKNKVLEAGKSYSIFAKLTPREHAALKLMSLSRGEKMGDIVGKLVRDAIKRSNVLSQVDALKLGEAK